MRGAIPSGKAALFQVDLAEAGRLVARIDASSGAPKIILLDSEGRILPRGFAQAAEPTADLLSVHLEAAPYFLLIPSFGGEGSFVLTARSTFDSLLLKKSSVGYSPQAMVMGDFNGDDLPDLATANSAGPFVESTVSILLGLGDGSFQTRRDFPLGFSPRSLVTGDFNGDGVADLAAANFGTFDSDFNTIPVTQNVTVLLGVGDGTFQTRRVHPVAFVPQVLVTGDFNGDGATDLAAISSDGTMSALLGVGDGTFQERQVLPGGVVDLAALVAGDFNGDGFTDLAASNAVKFDFDGNPIPGIPSVLVLLGNGDGTFQSQRASTINSYASALVVGDFDDDGIHDLATANTVDRTVSVLLGVGDGAYRDQRDYSVGDSPLTLVAGDFDNDGFTDLAAANIGGTVSVFPGSGDGTFQAQQVFPTGGIGLLALVTRDFNDDGISDLAALGVGDNAVSVLLGVGDGTFQAQRVFLVGLLPQALVSGDFNGDGVTDIATANSEDGGVSDGVVSGEAHVSVLLGVGDGTFQVQRVFLVGVFPESLVTGDFNGDGFADLATANIGDPDVIGTVSVLLGVGDGTFQAQRVFPVGIRPNALVTGDLNGDGVTDLAAANASDSTVSILLGVGDGTFQAQRVFPAGSTPRELVTGDFNGDGVTDLAAANLDVETVSVLLGVGDGGFGAPRGFAVGSTPDALATGDFNGDGFADLAAAVEGGDAVSVLLGVGDGTFQPQRASRVALPERLYPVDGYPDALASGDFDGDGFADLAVANSSNAVSVLLGRGDGTFPAPRVLPLGSTPESLTTGDFNGDSRPDVAIANAGTNYVSFLLSQGPGVLAPVVVVSNDSSSNTFSQAAILVTIGGVAIPTGPALVGVAVVQQGSGTTSNDSSTALGPALPSQAIGQVSGAPPTIDTESARNFQVGSSADATLGLLDNASALRDIALDSVFAQETSEAAVSSAFSALGGTPGEGVYIEGVGLALSGSRLTTRLDTGASLAFADQDPAASPGATCSVVAGAFSTLTGASATPGPGLVLEKSGDEGAAESVAAGPDRPATIAEPWERALLGLDAAYARAAEQVRDEVLGSSRPGPRIDPDDVGASGRRLPPPPRVVDAALSALAPESGSSGRSVEPDDRDAEHAPDSDRAFWSERVSEAETEDAAVRDGGTGVRIALALTLPVLIASRCRSPWASRRRLGPLGGPPRREGD